MKIRIIAILAVLILAGTTLGFSEENALSVPEALPAATTTPAAETATPTAPQENNDLANTQWVWGEVVSVNTQDKTLSLKYLDYETDQEKEVSIMTDDLTSYDNVSSLRDIQPKDNLSVDYILKDGKNIAKTIGLEKAEKALPAVNNVDAGVSAQAPQASQ
jgi:hypothetical protein